MPAPINYMQGFVDPTQSMMQTLQMGNMLGQMGERRDARTAEQDAQAAAEIAAQQKDARNAEIKALYDTALKNPTAENFQKLASYYPPEQQEAIRKGYTMLDEAAQKRLVNDSMDVFIAFDSGQPDIAISRLEEKVTAYKTAGNEKAAKDTQALVDLAKTGPKGAEAVEGMLGTNIALMDKDAMDGYAKYRESMRADNELLRINSELEEAKKTGGLDPEKKFASELSLNKEYETRTKAYNESLRLNSVIKDSAAANTGAGDLALINTFMKMLDPGSVVRESEFAQAQDTAGLVSKLAASLGRVKNGEVLVPAQREEFARLADQYMTAAGVHEKKVRDSLGFMVKNYGLNPENVFGTMAGDKTAKTPPAPGSTPSVGAYTDTFTGAMAFAREKWKDNPEYLKELDGIKTYAELEKAFGKTLVEFKSLQKTVQEPERTGTW